MIRIVFLNQLQSLRYTFITSRFHKTAFGKHSIPIDRTLRNGEVQITNFSGRLFRTGEFVRYWGLAHDATAAAADAVAATALVVQYCSDCGYHSNVVHRGRGRTTTAVVTQLTVRWYSHDTNFGVRTAFE